MNNAPVVAGAAIGSALMAASGVFSAEGLAVAGAAVIFVVAAFKFISNQNRRRMRPSSSPTEVHEPVEPPHKGNLYEPMEDIPCPICDERAAVEYWTRQHMSKEPNVR